MAVIFCCRNIKTSNTMGRVKFHMSTTVLTARGKAEIAEIAEIAEANQHLSYADN